MLRDVPNAKCRACGFLFPAPMFQDAVIAFGNATTCPRCGSVAPIENSAGGQVIGPRFVSDAVQAFRQASPEDLQRFQNVARRAKAGDLSRQAAVQEVREIGSAFNALMSHPAAGAWLTLLATLLSIYLYCQDQRDGDVKHAEMMDVLRRQAEASEEIRDQYEAARRAFPEDFPPLQVVPRPDDESRQVRRQRERLLGKGRRL